jgi:DNA-binding NarL/FixJ family response regulator
LLDIGPTVPTRRSRGQWGNPPTAGGKPTGGWRLAAWWSGPPRPIIRAVPRTVLIVDDNARFRVRARRLLEANGYAVVGEAADGAAAVEAARRLQPDVVLLDLVLPDMSGLSVAERLSGGLDAPAVVLTSTHDPSDFGDRLARCGARGFVPKSELSGEALAALLS